MLDEIFRLLYIKKMNSKSELRTKAKDIRKNLPICKISEELTKLVQEHAFYKNAQHVMIFYPTKYEINLLGLLCDNKHFYLPRVNNDRLLVCPYQVNEKLEKSSFNILEPCSTPTSAQDLDLVIVPALMADKYGYRLGYGGGFYDRFLDEFDGEFKTLTAIPKELFVEKLPVNQFDKKIDDILKI